MARAFAIALVSAALAMASVALADDLKFSTDLSGAEEVPPRVTDGAGEAEFEAEGGRVKFELEWEDLTTPAVAAHIHCAPAGANGPVGVTLFSGAMGTEGKVTGTFIGPDPGNACGWADLDDVIAAMSSGDTYVNVHTTRFPGGEIRGQIEADN